MNLGRTEQRLHRSGRTARDGPIILALKYPPITAVVMSCVSMNLMRIVRGPVRAKIRPTLR
jgi:hypothetical protein